MKVLQPLHLVYNDSLDYFINVLNHKPSKIGTKEEQEESKWRIGDY